METIRAFVAALRGTTPDVHPLPVNKYVVIDAHSSAMRVSGVGQKPALMSSKEQTTVTFAKVIGGTQNVGLPTDTREAVDALKLFEWTEAECEYTELLGVEIEIQSLGDVHLLRGAFLRRKSDVQSELFLGGREYWEALPTSMKRLLLQDHKLMTNLAVSHSDMIAVIARDYAELNCDPFLWASKFVAAFATEFKQMPAELQKDESFREACFMAATVKEARFRSEVLEQFMDGYFSWGQCTNFDRVVYWLSTGADAAFNALPKVVQKNTPFLRQCVEANPGVKESLPADVLAQVKE